MTAYLDTGNSRHWHLCPYIVEASGDSESKDYTEWLVGRASEYIPVITCERLNRPVNESKVAFRVLPKNWDM